jgi:DNA-binding MarR family transcriptional regulator
MTQGENFSVTARIISGDCTCYRLRQAARLLSRSYDAFLSPCGISIGQFGVLATLTSMEGQSISKLAEALQMDRTTLTRNLTPLRRLKYVAMESGPDRRVRSLSVTAGGKKALAAAMPRWQVAQRGVERQFGKSRVKSLNAKLDDLLKRLRTVDAGA